MSDENIPLEERVAKREHIVTDQGNGGSFCSNCTYWFGSDPSKHYDTCPSCGYEVVRGEVHINPGGSDF